MLHISHMQRQRVPAQWSYVLLVPGPSQGLVEPAVRVCVYRQRGQVERYSIMYTTKLLSMCVSGPSCLKLNAQAAGPISRCRPRADHYTLT